ncbi:MAG TPA: efflux RND transporter periplasmic adaptor subunit [Thiotrichales bacterium]|nr:efflux RND transporter periplasmic adaptor subunit [Thiotrichales bacterium]
MRRLLLLIPLLALLSTATTGAESSRLVVVRPFSELAIHPRIEVPATVLALDDSRVSAEISGRLLGAEVEVGARVEQGDLLARIDCREARSAEAEAIAALDAARARRDLAERQWRRAQALKRDRNISEELYSQRKAEREQAVAELGRAGARLDTARIRVSRCEVKAPFAGVVVERSAQAGMWVAPGTPLFRVVGTRRLEVTAGLDLRELETLRQAVDRGFEGGGRSRPLGEFRVVPVVRSESREVEVRFPVDGELFPGTAGSLWWQVGEPHLPAELVSFREGRGGVFVLENGRARLVTLPGTREGVPAAAPMLTPDTLIIVEGRHGLVEGQPVRVGDASDSRP